MLHGFQRERDESKEPVVMTITTRVPSKWRLIDLETGHCYEYGPSTVGQFRRIDQEQLMEELHGEG